ATIGAAFIKLESQHEQDLFYANAANTPGLGVMNWIDGGKRALQLQATVDSRVKLTLALG
ncbi:unnamed protein product, partial [Amoebophrya sp. A120]